MEQGLNDKPELREQVGIRTYRIDPKIYDELSPNPGQVYVVEEKADSEKGEGLFIAVETTHGAREVEIDPGWVVAGTPHIKKGDKLILDKWNLEIKHLPPMKFAMKQRVTDRSGRIGTIVGADQTPKETTYTLKADDGTEFSALEPDLERID